MKSEVVVATIAVLAYLSVCEGLKCYECRRWEVGIIHGGEEEDECEIASNKTNTEESDECKHCVVEYMDKIGFDFVSRKCFKEDMCESGEVTKQAVDFHIDALDKVSEYKMMRKCCNMTLCNGGDYDFDNSAINIHMAGSLTAAIFLSIYFNFRQ